MSSSADTPELSPRELADLSALADGTLDSARRAEVQARITASPCSERPVWTRADDRRAVARGASPRARARGAARPNRAAAPAGPNTGTPSRCLRRGTGGRVGCGAASGRVDPAGRNSGRAVAERGGPPWRSAVRPVPRRPLNRAPRASSSRRRSRISTSPTGHLASAGTPSASARIGSADARP